MSIYTHIYTYLYICIYVGNLEKKKENLQKIISELEIWNISSMIECHIYIYAIYVFGGHVSD